MSFDAEFVNNSGQSKRKPRYQPLLLAIVPFALGIVLDRKFDVPWEVWLVGCTMGLFIWGVATRVIRDGRAKLVLSLSLIAAFIALGGLWHHMRWNWYPANHIAFFAMDQPQLCCLRGQLTREPRVSNRDDLDSRLDPLQRPVQTKLRLQLSGIRDRSGWLSAVGQIDVVLHELPNELRSGDQLQVYGKLFGLKPQTNPGQFDFQNYMRSQRQLATVHVYRADAVQVIDRPRSWTGSRVLSSLRRKLNEVAWRLIDGDEAAFANAILLGNREQLSPMRRAAFLETGTAHLLAISGLHVGILATSIFLLCRLGLVERRKCLIMTIIFVLGYMWLVEFRPTVVRAAILISLFCIGRLVGQRAFSFNLLAAAAWIVLLLNPSDLFGVGPQLSFLAVGTMVFAKDWIWWPVSEDPIKKLIAGSRPMWLRWLCRVGRAFRATFMASTMIWFCSLPLVAWHFHLIAPAGLILNPLLMVPVACGLYAGAATLLFGWISDWPADFFGWLCEHTLGWIESAIQMAQSVPLSHFWTAGPPNWSLNVFYILLFFCVVHPSMRLPKTWVTCIGFSWLVFGWLLPTQAHYSNRVLGEQSMVCTFVDVGHGTGALVQFPNGQNLLYDCGSFSSSRYGMQNIADVLWSEGIIHLDAVVLSHADVDHFNAFPGLCERFSIGAVYLSPQMWQSNSDSVDCVRRVIERHGLSVRPVLSGFGTANKNGISIDVLNPNSLERGPNDNADSVVLRVSCNGRSVLLPGDLENESLDKLLARPAIQSDVLMLAHHGSRNSRPKELIGWCQPSIVVASCGRGRIKDDVAKMLNTLPCRFFHTDRDGAIRIEMTPEDINVVTHASGTWEARTMPR